ncbi:DUF3820 family protein [Parendozoicomonas sp. Alg238-R29]|uniref:DUF3820 family protein n=1 Tax=Parendozoicomonas sp. Alg238-R29 TaxID=2993446 RepID=UPI00248E2817|nr:DUF3820 family protein [Parendozoicomonas sp. Alg238-R29]
MFEKEDLLKLARMPMPFGKYKGQVLIDLPEEYLLWFAKKGMPKGDLGRLLQISLELHINGLTSVVQPLKLLEASGVNQQETVHRFPQHEE